MDAMDFPDSERGPVLAWELRRLIAARASGVRAMVRGAPGGNVHQGGSGRMRSRRAGHPVKGYHRNARRFGSPNPRGTSTHLLRRVAGLAPKFVTSGIGEGIEPGHPGRLPTPGDPARMEETDRPLGRGAYVVLGHGGCLQIIM